MNKTTTTPVPLFTVVNTATYSMPATTAKKSRSGYTPPDDNQVNTDNGEYYIAITNEEWNTYSTKLVSFLAEHIHIGNYKLKFAKNAANQVIAGRPVVIQFASDDYKMLFRLLTGGNLENVV